LNRKGGNFGNGFKSGHNVQNTLQNDENESNL
jgi:hypothetical protein